MATGLKPIFPGRRRVLAGLGILGGVAALLCVPQIRYAAGAAVTELRMLATARPVAGMLSDPAVPAATRDKLRFVQDVKAFGIQHLGLAPSDSYETYYDTGGKPLGWAVQAAWPDRLEPWLWHYPLLGSVPYQGFPRRRQAEQAAAALRDQGLETVVWPIPAYSTLGWLPDPVTSNLLEEEPAEIGATILHELLHGTIYFPSQSSLNETMAQFVGEQGMLAYYPEGSAEARRAQALWSDEATFAGFVAALVPRLQALYARHLPWPQTLRGRLAILADEQRIFQGLHFETSGYARFDCRHMNNAQLLGYVGYHDHLDWFVEARQRMGSAVRLVQFLQRVSPDRGGMPAALDELRRQGPDQYLATHAPQPPPLARRTIVSRWPWAAALVLILLLRGRQDLEGPWWLAVLVGLGGLMLDVPTSRWALGLLAGSVLWQRWRGRWPMPVDLVLTAAAGGPWWAALAASWLAAWAWRRRAGSLP